jgi:hypothetical protein
MLGAIRRSISVVGAADLTGPYFLRYSLADGTRPWDQVGDDLDEVIVVRPFRFLETKKPEQLAPAFRSGCR